MNVKALAIRALKRISGPRMTVEYLADGREVHVIDCAGKTPQEVIDCVFAWRNEVWLRQHRHLDLINITEQNVARLRERGA